MDIQLNKKEKENQWAWKFVTKGTTMCKVGTIGILLSELNHQEVEATIQNSIWRLKVPPKVRALMRPPTDDHGARGKESA